MNEQQVKTIKQDDADDVDDNDMTIYSTIRKFP